MDLNKLKTFLVVAETGSVSEAAAILYRTQPAISQQLKQLEKDTQLLLFERRNGRIFLTREGQDLYTFAKPKIQELEEKPLRMRQALTESEGFIRLGVLQFFDTGPLAKVIRLFQQKHPRVRFHIRAYDHASLCKALLENEIDMGMVIWYQNRDFFDISPLYTFQRSMAASTGYIQKQKNLCIDNFPALQILDNTQQLSDTYFWFNKYARDRVKKIPVLKPYLVSSDIHIYHQWILEGAGVGLVHDTFMESAYASGQLRKVFADSEPIFVTVDLAKRKTKNSSLAEEAFWDFAHLHLKQKS